jgi:enoyl-CoA hydratase/carnithine racemase
MACTLRIAADTARLGQPEISLGLIPGYAGTQRLSRLIGRGRAMDMILTGAQVSADEAQRIGLVHTVVPAEELAAAGEAMVARLLENGPQAMAETKACILESACVGFDRTTFDGLVRSHAAKRRSAEAAEGLASFAEKRPARWSGAQGGFGVGRINEA